MNWNAYPLSNSLFIKSEIEVIEFLIDEEPIPTPKIGDELTFEFPDNSRAGGVITNVAENKMQVKVNNILSNWVQVKSQIKQPHNRLTLTYLVES